MKKTMGALRWLKAFVLLALALVLLMASLMYIVDPFFQFRVRDNVYMLNPRYVNAGLIKNHDYNSIIIGSSVTQNFDMDIFRQELGVEPLHVSMGGITARETAELIELAKKSGRAESFYVGIDLHCFSVADTASNNPAYLFSDRPLDMAKYLLSYEAWFRFMPVDMAFAALKAANVSLPPKFSQSTSIDMLANWEADFIYEEENVIRGFRENLYAVSDVDTEGLRQRMDANFDMVFEALEGIEDKTVLFFPPYSYLYWYNARDYRDIYLDAKADFIARAEALGCTVYDFQHSELCMDLNNYRDSSHYSGDVNDWMTRCFASGEYRATSADCAKNRAQLEENIALFFEKYGERIFAE